MVFWGREWSELFVTVETCGPLSITVGTAGRGAHLSVASWLPTEYPSPPLPPPPQAVPSPSRMKLTDSISILVFGGTEAHLEMIGREVLTVSCRLPLNSFCTDWPQVLHPPSTYSQAKVTECTIISSLIPNSSLFFNFSECILEPLKYGKNKQTNKPLRCVKEAALRFLLTLWISADGHTGEEPWLESAFSPWHAQAAHLDS